jgi:ryanodine receptor 2
MINFEVTMDPYEPGPIDTSAVELTEELVELTEQLAANAHENWAKHRMREGWRWGPARSDLNRTHPDLIPYSQLDERAKQYDRLAVTEMLRTIIALGYRIEPARD